MIPTIEEARALMQEHNKEEFHRTHAETVSAGSAGNRAVKRPPPVQQMKKARSAERAFCMHEAKSQRFASGRGIVIRGRGTLIRGGDDVLTSAVCEGISEVSAAG